MRKKLNELFKGEAFKMRDVAFGPTFYIMSAMPIVLVIAVIALAIFAAVKIAKISKNKKDKVE